MGKLSRTGTATYCRAPSSQTVRVTQTRLSSKATETAAATGGRPLVTRLQRYFVRRVGLFARRHDALRMECSGLSTTTGVETRSSSREKGQGQTRRQCTLRPSNRTAQPAAAQSMGDAPVVVWEIWQWVGRLQRRAEVPAIDVRLGTERTTWGLLGQKKKNRVELRTTGGCSAGRC